ncbi:hypothetical protein HY638_00380 [Candidatus Woesearchaeota archaeon]|nr:hypothetical protein [Candidatus Woesearchaeota archaeon]
MKKLIVVCSLALLLVGCVEKSVCNKPYITVGKDCCLDTNDNKVCDKEDNQSSTVTSSKTVNMVDLLPPELNGCIESSNTNLMNEYGKQNIEKNQIIEMMEAGCGTTRIFIAQSKKAEEMFSSELKSISGSYYEGSYHLEYDGSRFYKDNRIETYSGVNPNDDERRYHLVYITYVGEYLIELDYRGIEAGDIVEQFNELLITKVLQNLEKAGIK